MNLDVLLTHPFLKSPDLHDIDMKGYREELRQMYDLIKLTKNEEQIRYICPDSPRTQRQTCNTMIFNTQDRIQMTVLQNLYTQIYLEATREERE